GQPARAGHGLAAGLLEGGACLGPRVAAHGPHAAAQGRDGGTHAHRAEADNAQQGAEGAGRGFGVHVVADEGARSSASSARRMGGDACSSRSAALTMCRMAVSRACRVSPRITASAMAWCSRRTWARYALSSASLVRVM